MIILHVEISKIVTLSINLGSVVLSHICFMLNDFGILSASISIVTMTVISQLSRLLVCGNFVILSG